MFCSTEYKRDGVIYRAHPNYRSSGKWEDWALVAFDEGAADSVLYPSRFLCFIDADLTQPDTGMYAVIQCTTSQIDRLQSFCLQHWNMKMFNDSDEPFYSVVSVDTLDGVTFVIQSNAHEVVEVLPMSKWSEQF